MDQQFGVGWRRTSGGLHVPAEVIREHSKVARGTRRRWTEHLQAWATAVGTSMAAIAVVVASLALGGQQQANSRQNAAIDAQLIAIADQSRTNTVMRETALSVNAVHISWWVLYDDLRANVVLPNTHEAVVQVQNRSMIPIRRAYLLTWIAGIRAPYVLSDIPPCTLVSFSLVGSHAPGYGMSSLVQGLVFSDPNGFWLDSDGGTEPRLRYLGIGWGDLYKELERDAKPKNYGLFVDLMSDPLTSRWDSVQNCG